MTVRPAGRIDLILPDGRVQRLDVAEAPPDGWTYRPQPPRLASTVDRRRRSRWPDALLRGVDLDLKS